jgi:hypothetical protein
VSRPATTSKRLRQPEGVKLFTPHRDGCHAAPDPEHLVFIVHQGVTFDRKINGHRGGSTMWHAFRCNDPFCPAEAGVRWDVLAAFIGNLGDEEAGASPQTQEGATTRAYDQEAGDAIDTAAEAIERIASEASHETSEEMVNLLIELAGDIRSVARGGKVLRNA